MFGQVSPAVAIQQQIVRNAYSAYGVGSQQYEDAFDRLHDMRMHEMANNFRKARGLPPGSKTPYCK